MERSKLVKGKIPPHTECPYRETCSKPGRDLCNHLGKDHTVEFSCGLARAFDIINRYEKD